MRPYIFSETATKLAPVTNRQQCGQRLCKFFGIEYVIEGENIRHEQLAIAVRTIEQVNRIDVHYEV